MKMMQGENSSADKSTANIPSNRQYFLKHFDSCEQDLREIEIHKA